MNRLFFILTLVVAAVPGATAQGRRRAVEPRPGDLASLAAKIGSGVQWAANEPTVLAEGRNRAEVSESLKAHRDFDRSAALDAALKEAAEMRRPVLLYMPRITAGTRGRQMYRPAVLDRYARAVFFTDPECVDVINRRYVAVRLTCDEAIGKRLGIQAPDAVEPAIYILGPGGKILRHIDHIRSFNAAWFDAWLRGPIEDGRAFPPAQVALPRDSKFADRLAMVADQLRSGIVRREAVALKPPAGETHAADRSRLLELRARAARRRGDLEQARQLAEQAGEEAGENRTELSNAACEAGRIALLQQRIDDAADWFSKVRAGPRVAEARYHMGLCEFFSGSSRFAERRWRSAAAIGPDEPYAWRAAANIVLGRDRTPVGPAPHGFEDPFYREVDAARTTTAMRRDPSAAARVARDAVRFLLRMQREDGSWPDSRYAYWSRPEETPNVWVAATALSCAALLAWRDIAPEAIDDAVRRGERYAFTRHRINRGVEEEIYAEGYKLFYLTRKYDATTDPARRPAIVARMNAIVRRLADLQDKGRGRRKATSRGFWAHEYPNGFCTASVMNALHLARERGADVPETVMLAGAEALLSIRDDDGAYAYAAGRKPRGPKEERLKNSMARSPIAEAAVLWAGHPDGSPARVAAAVDNFWKYLPRFERIRTCDFHTDGELGGFFFWHGIFHTSEAFRAAPAARHELDARRLLEHLTRLEEMDGSFIDSHEIGKSYGTAMGLLSLRNVLKKKNP